MWLFASFLLQNFAVDCTSAAAKPMLFGLIPWYQYLTLAQNSSTYRCDITNFHDTSANGILGLKDNPLLLIALAVLDDLLRIAAMVAVGYVIWGGIQYVTSQGSPDSTRKAQQTIINALIGVAIAILAAAMVGFVGNSLGS